MHTAAPPRIPLTRPALGAEVERAALRVLQSGALAEGPVAEALEAQAAAYLGCEEVVAVASGTAALEFALRALRVGPGDEVIVPDYTDPATAAAVCAVGARPVLVDVSPETLLLDLDAAEAAITERTRALVPVSLFGNPLDWERLAALRRRRAIPVVEDAAGALGAELGGRRIGGLADATIFSLGSGNLVAAGQGGLLATRRPELARWVRDHKRGGDGARGRYGTLGVNGRLSDVVAAIRLAQLTDAPARLERLEALAARYEASLAELDEVVRPRTTPGGRHARQTFCVLVPERDRVLRELRAGGIEARRPACALHAQPALADPRRCRPRGPFPAARAACGAGLALPLFDGMKSEQQQEVLDALGRALWGG